MKPLLALLKRDIKLAWRQGGGLGAALGFMLAVIVLIPLSIGPDQNLLQRLAPGLMWLTLLLAVLLTAERMFAADLEDGSLDVMTTGSLSLEWIAVIKIAAHWLTVSLPLAILAPLLGFMFNLDAAQLPQLLLAMITGSLALSAIAAIGGAITAGLRRGGLLVALLILPLYVPILIFGVSVTQSALGPQGATSALTVLAGLTLLSLIAAPFAAAAALRSFLR
jgi:heme exporter protein B